MLGVPRFLDFVFAPGDRHPHGFYALDHGRNDPHTAFGRANIQRTNAINEKGCKQSINCHIPFFYSQALVQAYHPAKSSSLDSPTTITRCLKKPFPNQEKSVRIASERRSNRSARILDWLLQRVSCAVFRCNGDSHHGAHSFAVAFER